MNGETEPEPKIGGAEGFLMVGFAAVFDIIDFLATFLDGFFGVGELIKFFTGLVASVTLWLWAMMKEVGPERILAGSLLEFVPVVNALPLRTVTTAMTVWLDWHPQEAELAQTVVPNLKNPRRIPGGRARGAKPVKPE